MHILLTETYYKFECFLLYLFLKSYYKHHTSNSSDIRSQILLQISDHKFHYRYQTTNPASDIKPQIPLQISDLKSYNVDISNLKSCCRYQISNLITVIRPQILVQISYVKSYRYQISYPISDIYISDN